MDYYKLFDKRSVTPLKLVEILGTHGKVVNIERAKKILGLIYKLSNLSVKETLRSASELNPNIANTRFKRHSRKRKDHESC